MKELLTIQQELKAPKDKFNEFGKYKYRSCEGILESVKPILNRLDCTLTLSDDIVDCAGRAFVKSTAELINSSGDSYRVSALAEVEVSKKGMDASQITGSASSYARKYALNGLFAIDDSKDADTNEYHTQKDNETNDYERQSLDLISKASSVPILVGLYNANVTHWQSNQKIMTALGKKKQELIEAESINQERK